MKDVETILQDVLEQASPQTHNAELTQQNQINSKEQHEYELRLLTFQAATYNPGTSCLSPLLCARFGWENADVDMLVCSGCQSALNIPLNLGLISSNPKYVETLRHQIVSEGHTSLCPFRTPMTQFQKYDDADDTDDHEDIKNENNSDKEGNNTVQEDTGTSAFDPQGSNADDTADNLRIVPTYMSDYVPNNFLKLMEYPKPRALIRNRMKNLFEPLHCQQQQQQQLEKDTTTPEETEAAPTKWTYPRMELPPEILDCQDIVPGLLDLEDDTNATKRSGELHRENGNITCLGLALLGWQPIESLTMPSIQSNSSDHGKRPPMVSLGCPVCFAVMDNISLVEQKSADVSVDDGSVVVIDGDDEPPDENDEDPTRPTKRHQSFSSKYDPLACHRYYCPYVTGFPRTAVSHSRPVWKTVLERLIREERQSKNNNNNNLNITNAIDDGATGPSNSDLSATTLQQNSITEKDAVEESLDDISLSIGRIKRVLYSAIATIQQPSTVVDDKET